MELIQLLKIESKKQMWSDEDQAFTKCIMVAWAVIKKVSIYLDVNFFSILQANYFKYEHFDDQRTSDMLNVP